MAHDATAMSCQCCCAPWVQDRSSATSSPRFPPFAATDLRQQALPSSVSSTHPRAQLIPDLQPPHKKELRVPIPAGTVPRQPLLLHVAPRRWYGPPRRREVGGGLGGDQPCSNNATELCHHRLYYSPIARTQFFILIWNYTVIIQNNALILRNTKTKSQSSIE